MMEKRNKKKEIRWGVYTETKLSLSVFLFSFFFFPSLAFADFPPNLNGFVCLFLSYFTVLIPILNAVALLLFFWGLARFILHADDTKEHANGRQFMIWGIVALFCLISIWGIIQFLGNQFNFGTQISMPLLPADSAPSCGSIESVNSIFKP